ncbi:MAG: DEAD/DEAH box helicase family protein [Spirochaetaceae bacterium]|nr:DEAD/DEAH box helicase family protein [Spirochaetaceae bacterium]
MSDTLIRDNKNYGSVGDFLKDVIKEGSELSVVSAYFTIFAYYGLRKNLDKIKSMRFLFGEPTFIEGINTDTRSYKIEDDSIIISPIEKFSQKTIASKCAEWIKEKVEVKSIVKPNFLHGKMYYADLDSKGYPKAISGSSNFTTSGLGLKKEANNIELNLIVDSDRQKEELKGWFDSIWNDTTGLVQDVKDEVLKYLEMLYKENEPEFVYFKTLYSIFKDYLDEQKDNKLFDETAFKDTAIWNKLYEFQKDGVKGAINKLLKHNGCIIADSVGLGKTFEALAVIKYFELKNYRVLVLCPKKLSDNWTVYQAAKNSKLNILEKDRFQYTVLYHTDMGRENGKSGADGIDFKTFNWAAYDLVVIDESHNFKGNPMEKETTTGEKHMNRAKWLMEKIIKSGSKTKVLMLSATPVNNTLKDLRNQINLITEGNQSALYDTSGISDIAQTLETAQKQFSTWADPKKNPERTTKQLMEKLDSSFFKLLDELTIARSRKHIIKFYNEADVGKFPERRKPIPVYSKIDTEDEFPEYSAINAQISNYQLSIFNPSKYIKDEKKDYYAKLAGSSVDTFIQDDREKSLIGMMKVGYLKRLESSIHSFAISIDRTVNQIKELLDKIDEYEKLPEDQKAKFATQNQIEQDFENDEDFADNADSSGDFDNADLFVGKKLKFSLADLKLDEWKKDLRSDRSAMIMIRDTANKISAERDAKLADLKKLIKDKVEHPINPNNKKIVIFTAFSDTAEYLYKEIQPWAKKELELECGMVCGSKSSATFGENDFNMILTNFAPKAKHRDELGVDKSKEIDILIATDCISEGQNLQDCDYLINYDIHWNPVRIIQRFGRIDRLGSTNTSIQLVNFWPTQDLDDYINLKTRVESRMALVDLTATAEDNILKTDEVKELIDEDLKYRDQQLKRLKDEVLDLEDMVDSISLTDFTLDDFRVELSNFIKENSAKLDSVPDGIYAIIPSPQNTVQLSEKNFDEAAKKIIKPGVIYCLRQKNADEECEKINPLNPYFLVYIYEDGSKIYNYTSAKSILEVYRLLCSGEKAPYDKLCELFNTETNSGTDMSKYSALLEKSVTEITSSFKKRNAMKLTTSRNAVLIKKDKQASNVGDFELVTWLIIK